MKVDKRGRRRKEGKSLPKRWEPAFWEQADSRHRAIRLVRERVEALSADVGADSEPKRLLVSRAVFLAVQLESMEVRAASGQEPLDFGKWTQGTNALVGLLKTLGIERQVKEVTLTEHLAKKYPKRKGRRTK